jgi:hypothetical protein
MQNYVHYTHKGGLYKNFMFWIYLILNVTKKTYSIHIIYSRVLNRYLGTLGPPCYPYDVQYLQNVQFILLYTKNLHSLLKSLR